jgi:hypothetical protein
MLYPSPTNSSNASSVQSSDDEMIRALKRMRIDHERSKLTHGETVDASYHKAKNIADSRMVMVEVGGIAKKPSDAERKAKMRELLQKHMTEYKSQYASMSQDPSVTHCDGM